VTIRKETPAPIPCSAPFNVNQEKTLASFHFLKNTKGSSSSNPLRGAEAAARFAKTQGGGLSIGTGGGRRPSASLCGNAFDFVE
jgi:hypothetical protein